MDLSEAVLCVLYQHRGEENFITRVSMLDTVNQLTGGEYDDRVMREMIAVLRVEHPDGALICSRPGKGGGYWMAKNQAEMDTYIASERSRIKKISHKLTVQKRRSKIAFGLQQALGI
jgi:hypothetical protein